MLDFGIILFFLAGTATVIAVAIKPVRVFEYPFFMTITFLGLFGPQIMILWNNHGFLPQNSFERIIGLVNLCIGGCWLGYLPPPRVGMFSWLRIRLSVPRLEIGGLILAIIGCIFAIIVEVYGEDIMERDESGNATGTYTVLLFFAVLNFPALAICSNLLLRKRYLIPVIGCVLSLWFPIYIAIAQGRREPTILTILIILTSLYFTRGFAPPRWLLVPGFIFTSLIIQVIGDYRTFITERGVGAAIDFNLLEVFQSRRDITSAQELNMACLQTDYILRYDSFNLGASYWNNLVFRFVPGQFVGADLKRSLFLPVAPPLFSTIQEHPVYAAPGTTPSGMADSFMEFGYLGWLVFALFSYVCKCLWLQCEQGSFPAQVIYASSLTGFMRGITHQTVDTPPAILYVFFAVAAVFWFSRVQHSKATS